MDSRGLTAASSVACLGVLPEVPGPGLTPAGTHPAPDLLRLPSCFQKLPFWEAAFVRQSLQAVLGAQTPRTSFSQGAAALRTFGI